MNSSYRDSGSCTVSHLVFVVILSCYRSSVTVSQYVTPSITTEEVCTPNASARTEIAGQVPDTKFAAASAHFRSGEADDSNKGLSFYTVVKSRRSILEIP